MYVLMDIEWVTNGKDTSMEVSFRYFLAKLDGQFAPI